MKKFIPIILILSLFSAVSCEKKQNIQDDNFSDTPIVEETNQNAEENVFRELSDSDFTDITVKASPQDNTAPPVNVELTDISDLNFGTRISPCKLPENRSIHRNNLSFSNLTDEDFNKYCELPSEPEITKIRKHGNKIFIAVNYDNLDNFCGHEFSVFSYDTDTDELTEILRHSDPITEISISDITVAKGNIYVLAKEVEGSTFTESETPNSYRFFLGEIKDGKINKIQDCDSFAFADLGNDSLTVIETNQSYREFDFESGKLLESVHLENAFIPCICNNKFIDHTENADKNLVISTDKYTLNTELRGKSSLLCSASDKRCSIMFDDNSKGTSNHILYTYNLEKMERYIINMDGIGNMAYPAGDNLIINSQFNDFYYMIPELGAIFPIDGGSFGTYNFNDMVNKNTWVFGGQDNGSPYIYEYSPHSKYSYYTVDGQMKIENTETTNILKIYSIG